MKTISRIVFLVLLSNLLFAQSNNWQSYFFSGYITGGADTGDQLWLVGPSSILNIDKNTGEEQVVYFDNAPISQTIHDIYQSDSDEFWVLSGANHLSRWKAGSWSDQYLEAPLPINPRKIIGQAPNGDFFLKGSTKIYRWNGGVELMAIPLSGTAIANNVKIDSQGQLWIWSVERLSVYDQNYELIFQEERMGNYLNEVEVDEVGRVWTIGSLSVDIWFPLEERWESFDRSGLGINEGPNILTIKNGEAIVSSRNQLVRLSYSPTQGLSSEYLIPASAGFALPPYFMYWDSDDQVWFLDSYGNKLKCWNEASGLHIYSDNPWLPLSNLSAMSLDPQGKVWLGGRGQPAYMMGGRWHVFASSTENDILPMQVSTSSILFNATGQPVLGTRSLQPWNDVNNHLLEWNGYDWDTLALAGSGQDFLSIREITRDQKKNLWVMGTEGSFLLLEKKGQWHRFQIEDMPVEASYFTCITPGADDQMWFGTNRGAVLYDGNSFLGFDSDALGMGTDIVRDITVDEGGAVWISLGAEGVRKWDDQQLEVVLSKEQLPEDTGASALASDRKGGLWLSLGSQGVMHYDGEEWEHLRVADTGLPKGNIKGLLVDHRERVWFNINEIVSVYTPQGNSIVPFFLKTEQSLSIYPNPGCCQFMVHWEASQSGNYDFNLINGLGQVVKHWPIAVDSAGEQFFNFYIYDLSFGAYILQLTKDQQQISSTQLLISR